MLHYYEGSLGHGKWYILFICTVEMQLAVRWPILLELLKRKAAAAQNYYSSTSLGLRPGKAALFQYLLLRDSDSADSLC